MLCIPLNAVGRLPHMIFLVDFVARGLGKGVQVGSEFWVVFGIAATIGPLAVGRLADRIGFGPALRLALLLEAGAVVIRSFVPVPLVDPFERRRRSLPDRDDPAGPRPDPAICSRIMSNSKRRPGASPPWASR